MILYSILTQTGRRTFYASRPLAVQNYEHTDDACGIDRHEFELTKFLLLQLLNSRWPIGRFLALSRTKVLTEVGRVAQNNEVPDEG